MTKSSHIHKLKRLKYKSGNITFFCALPDCNFKINPALALGKRSLCWRCGKDFIMNEYALRLAKPHCQECHKPKKEVVDIEDRTFDSETKLGPSELSLSERLSQTIKQAQTEEEEI
jgi:hypothetical protein